MIDRTCLYCYKTHIFLWCESCEFNKSQGFIFLERHLSFSKYISISSQFPQIFPVLHCVLTAYLSDFATFSLFIYCLFILLCFFMRTEFHSLQGMEFLEGFGKKKQQPHQQLNNLSSIHINPLSAQSLNIHLHGILVLSIFYFNFSNASFSSNLLSPRQIYVQLRITLMSLSFYV